MQPKKNYKIIWGLLVISLLFVTAGCAQKNSQANAVKKIQAKGTLVIGTSADFAPFEFPIVKDGKKQIVGYDIMLAQKIADDLDVKLKVENVEFSSLISEVKNKKVDLVLAGLSATKQRKQSISFSIPYYTSHNVLLIRKGDQSKYQSLQELKQKNIGVQQGSTQETYAQKQLKGSQLVVESLVTSLATELKEGKIDGIVVGDKVAANYVAKFPEQYAVASIKLPTAASKQTYSVGIAKGNHALVKRVNRVIKKLQKNGTDEKLFNRAKQLQEKYGSN
ncbi:glutamate ABC transporter substrate-binding protein [Liquorilactobacillus satsumensis]|uniref:Glutamate ABC transporter substrate-binding protein n=2 Tax=Lactobacillaceae TaxID=33958 RepID=A0A3Q8CYI4_9LACO|nr:transporter substrate-binding domain-containing protein [Liquorilactobacillus satsumensis]AUJ31021.1 glutamate ABC transporter substrate-binding protein [Liquorilactobacillus hordei]MCC7667536.1 glutamate ABC transporter substrate-binding protein [Liquorilactobacillus satsumensis]